MFFKKKREKFFTFISYFLLCFLSLSAILLPLLYKSKTCSIHPLAKSHPPSRDFWFGCDLLGRDLFFRTWKGLRLTLFITACSVSSALCIGGGYATLFTFASSTQRRKMQTFLNLFTSIPSLLPAMYLHATISSPLLALIGALTFSGWRSFARTLSLQMVQLQQRPFVQTSLNMGASHKFIFYQHLLPHCRGAILTTSMNCVVSCVFTEAFLSFLGLGVPPPSITLGSLMNDGIVSLMYYPWLFFFPAMIYASIVIICLTLGNTKKLEVSFLDD